MRDLRGHDAVRRIEKAACVSLSNHRTTRSHAGIMSGTLVGGDVRTGVPIRMKLPPEPHQSLDPV
jgi:hypothetical protein